MRYTKFSLICMSEIRLWISDDIYSWIIEINPTKMTLTVPNLWSEKTILELFAELLTWLAMYFQSKLHWWIKSICKIQAYSLLSLPRFLVKLLPINHEGDEILLKIGDTPGFCCFAFYFQTMLDMFLVSTIGMMALLSPFPLKAANSARRTHSPSNTLKPCCTLDMVTSLHVLVSSGQTRGAWVCVC